MSGGLSLAVIAGVPIGTFAGQFAGWRGPFWMLAVLAVLAAVAVQRYTPAHNDSGRETLSIRDELAALRSWRMWTVLGAVVLAQAGFLGAYSYITPLLTERVGLPPGAVPVVLVGFGIGALAGTTLGGRFGDRRPLATIAVAVTLTTTTLLLLVPAADHRPIAVGLVVVLGACGLGANPVLIAQVLRYAGTGSTLASALATAAFNLGTAAGSALAASMLTTSLELVGPPVLGAALAGAALVPIAVLAVTGRPERPDRTMETNLETGEQPCSVP